MKQKSIKQSGSLTAGGEARGGARAAGGGQAELERRDRSREKAENQEPVAKRSAGGHALRRTAFPPSAPRLSASFASLRSNSACPHPATRHPQACDDGCQPESGRLASRTPIFRAGSFLAARSGRRDADDAPVPAHPRGPARRRAAASSGWAISTNVLRRRQGGQRRSSTSR